jgi:hypothetical protein
LRKNLGLAPGDPRHAHHIVPGKAGTTPAANRARELLTEYQIDINDAANGVGLLPHGKPSHYEIGLHTEKAIERVGKRLERAIAGIRDWATGRQKLLDELAKIRQEILDGRFP